MAGVGLGEFVREAHDLLAELRDAVAPDREARGELVPAVALEQRRERFERLKQVEASVRARGRLALLAVETDEKRRAAVFLGQARGDDADHALMPGLVREDDGLRHFSGRQHRERVAVDAALDLLPLAVELAEPRGELGRARGVVRQKQLGCHAHLAHAAGRVDARG